MSSSPQRLGVDFGKVREAGFRGLMVRFGFGFGVSVVAALVTLKFGPLVGGVFLAFPAILPASLTLLEEKEGESAARHDAGGAVIGSLGMVAFAVTGFLLLGRVAPGPALGFAFVAWTAVSAGLYMVSRRVLPEGSRNDPS